MLESRRQRISVQIEKSMEQESGSVRPPEFPGKEPQQGRRLPHMVSSWVGVKT